MNIETHNQKPSTDILNNLPNRLNSLYIYNKFDNLPENLKGLKIDNYDYTLDDFENLPNYLKSIIINDKKYNSTEKLVNNFI